VVNLPQREAIELPNKTSTLKERMVEPMSNTNNSTDTVLSSDNNGNNESSLFNGIQDSINVLRSAKVGELLCIVFSGKGGQRSTKLLRVDSRETARGRNGSTTLGVTDISRKGFRSFPVCVTVSTLPNDIVTAHRVLGR